MIDYRLRRVEAADSPALYELNSCTLRSYVEQVFGCWDGDVQRDFHQQWMNRQRAQVIEVDGRVVGVVSVEWRATELHLARIQVTPELQNRGIGSAVISDLIRQAAGRGCAAARLRGRAGSL